MSKADEIIGDIMKTMEIWYKIPKPIQKIKMKEEFYNELAREVQEQVNITEVLDKDGQPLNRLCDIRIEIDNSIDKDYEVVR